LLSFITLSAHRLVDDPLLRRITVIAISTGAPPAILAITSIICGAFQSQSGSTGAFFVVWTALFTET
jgi:hypothetical protein